jgi:hypothetical protein
VQCQAGYQGTLVPIKRKGTPTPDQVTEPEHKHLMKEGKYFTCKRSGHLSCNCPEKATTMQLKVLEKDATIDNTKGDSENNEA